MPNLKSISFKMAVLQGGRQNLPPPQVCVIQKTPCGIGKEILLKINLVIIGKTLRFIRGLTAEDTNSQISQNRARLCPSIQL